MADAPDQHDDFLRRTATAVGFTALAVVLLFAMYVAAGALLLLYVSVLLAIGSVRWSARSSIRSASRSAAAGFRGGSRFLSSTWSLSAR